METVADTCILDNGCILHSRKGYGLHFLDLLLNFLIILLDYST